MLRLKRIYEPAVPEDGYRILVDRLWPRGLSKQAAAVDWWLKDIAPSPGLRRWFGHDPAHFEEFTRLYESELVNNPAVEQLRAACKKHAAVTLLYGSRDTRVNHAVVLKNYLEFGS